MPLYGVTSIARRAVDDPSGLPNTTNTRPSPADAAASAGGSTFDATSRGEASITVPSSRTATARRSCVGGVDASAHTTSQREPSKATTGPPVTPLDAVASRRPPAGSRLPAARVARSARISVVVVTVAETLCARATSGRAAPAATDGRDANDGGRSVSVTSALLVPPMSVQTPPRRLLPGSSTLRTKATCHTQSVSPPSAATLASLVENALGGGAIGKPSGTPWRVNVGSKSRITPSGLLPMGLPRQEKISCQPAAKRAADTPAAIVGPPMSPRHIPTGMLEASESSASRPPVPPARLPKTDSTKNPFGTAVPALHTA